MEYMSAPQAAKKWGISERRVQILCKENRIPGASKLGYMWLIPRDAEKPIDGRRKSFGGKKEQCTSSEIQKNMIHYGLGGGIMQKILIVEDDADIQDIDVRI